MNYRNGKEVLPEWLLEKLQEYVQGELIYIPRQSDSRAGWGTVNGTRIKIQVRNLEICSLYERGTKVEELTERFHLSEDSIRKVLSSRRQLRQFALVGEAGNA